MRSEDLQKLEPAQRLLHWVLSMFVASLGRSGSMDRWLGEMLYNGFAGDPGWEIDYIQEGKDGGRYRVTVNPEYLGDNEPAEVICDGETFRRAVRQMLQKFVEDNPARTKEITKLISKYRL